MGEKNVFLCPFKPIVTMLVLNNYDDEFAGRKMCRSAKKHPFVHKNGCKVTEKDRTQGCQIASLVISQNNNPTLLVPCSCRHITKCLSLRDRRKTIMIFFWHTVYYTSLEMIHQE